MGVTVGVLVFVGVGVSVGDTVSVGIGVSVGVLVGVSVKTGVSVGVEVLVGVSVDVLVLVAVGEFVKSIVMSSKYTTIEALTEGAANNRTSAKAAVAGDVAVPVTCIQVPEAVEIGRASC